MTNVRPFDIRELNELANKTFTKIVDESSYLSESALSLISRLQIERSLLKRFSCLLFVVWLQSPTVVLASTHTNIWRFWGGGWLHVTSIGGLTDEQAADRSFLLLGFGYSRILRQNHTTSIRYSLDIILVDTQMPIVLPNQTEFNFALDAGQVLSIRRFAIFERLTSKEDLSNTLDV